MKRVFFKTYTDLAEYMIETKQNNIDVVAALFYKQVIQLIKEFIFLDVNVSCINIEPEYYSNYYKEYYVTVDEDLKLSVEPAFVDNRYLSSEAELLLLDSEASTTLIKGTEYQHCLEINIEKMNYSREDYDLLKDEIIDSYYLEKDNNGNIIGFSFDMETDLSKSIHEGDFYS